MPRDNRQPPPPHLSTLTAGADRFPARYLSAKKEVDDRALNRLVWEKLRQTLPQTAGREPVSILEIGAGIGTMLARVVDWGLLTGDAIYAITDSAEDHFPEGRKYLSRWARQRGHHLSWIDQRHGRLITAGADVRLAFGAASVQALADGSGPPGLFHLLIAHAVLDLIDFPVLLPKLLQRLHQNGLAYLTCNFDGETLFLPEDPGPEEKKILTGYHASMEARLSGASVTGRRLLAFLHRPELDLLAAGSSDWIIHPRNGHYTTEETFFLNAMVAMVERELTGKPTDATAGLSAWTALRRRQIQAGELTFLARHLDVLARRRPLS
ncbi:MAG: hypothetical protein WBY88_16465 [Desulfosarcina sp.]